MVAVVSQPGASVYGALAYNIKQGDGSRSVIISGNDVVYSPGAEQENITTLVESFKPYLDANKRTKYPVFHCSLNPHPEDRIDDVQLAVIAEDFMREMGYGNQPYVVFKHMDTGRTHLHIVSVRIDIEGKKLPHFKEGEKAGKIAEKLEEKYGLTRARDSRQVDLAQFKRVDPGTGNLKRQIKSVLHTVTDRFSFKGYGEFNTLLNLYGITVEHIRGHIDGRPYEGIVYRALDQHGNKTGPAFKSSILGREFGCKAMERRFTRAKQALKGMGGRMDELKNIFDMVINTDPHIEKLTDELLKNKVILKLNTNEERITGVTLIDFGTGNIFKGSDLGKSYSANALNEKILSDETAVPITTNSEDLFNLIDGVWTTDFEPVPIISPGLVNRGYDPVLLLRAQQSLDSWEPFQGDRDEPQIFSTHRGHPEYEELELYKAKRRKKDRNI